MKSRDVFRLLAKAFRHTHDPPDDGGGEPDQPSDPADRLREGDRVVIDTPISGFTYNELHAAKYGVLGLFVGLWYAATGGVEPLVVSVGVVATALGFRAVEDGRRTFAIRTIRHEAHYFVASYAVSFGVGVLVAGFTGTP